MADKKQNLVKYGEVVAKCWEDEAYKKRFLEDPEGVLAEAGFVVEEGVTYKVVEQPKQVKYVVLPHADAKEAVQGITKAFLNQVEQKDTVIPEGAEVRIIQNTDDIRYMVLPASPKSLTKSELAAAAGGDSVATATNIVQSAEVATTGVAIAEVVVAEAGTAATTYMAGAEIGVVVVAVGVLV
ncbi:MAG: NHLP leader peptide family RiPP precursor [Schwartzia sp.]|nr:NHLP leader peptide family RiPP precursor [Schwartzia sp. (in: firmicutes)]